VDSGYTTFILDEPATAEEMWHTGVVFEHAQKSRAAAA
jgi:hypothetical protein